jgi:hypothetical protein
MANSAAISQYLSWRLTTLGGLKYKLLEGYPTIEQGEDSTTATEKYLIRSQDVGPFSYESMPPPYVIGFFIVQPPNRAMPGSNGWAVTRSVSYAPHGPGLPGDPIGMDPSAPAGTYTDLYEVTIQYSTGKAAEDRDPNDPQTFLEHSMQVGGEFYQLKSASQYYDKDVGAGIFEVTNIESESVPGAHKAVITIEHNLRWPFVLVPDWVTIMQSLGTTNIAVKPLFKNAPIETVLFSGVSGTQKYVWNGTSAYTQPWNLDFKFSQRCLRIDGVDITWNHSFYEKAGKWVKPYYWSGGTKSSGTKVYMYEKTDLYKLFLTA